MNEIRPCPLLAPAIRDALDELQDAQDALSATMAEPGASVAAWSLACARHSQARDALVDAIARIPDEDFVLAGRKTNGWLVLLTRSARQPGMWQTTRFDANEQPWGDSLYHGKHEAIREALFEFEVESLRETMGLPPRAHASVVHETDSASRRHEQPESMLA